jgi:PPOX class probable F420-dependent enzyme
MDLQQALAWAGNRSNGVLITIRKDGRPQSSDVAYRIVDDLIEVSITDGRAKTANLRRDPRAVFHLTDPPSWSYLSFDGTVDLTDTATAPDDPTADALVSYYRAVAGKDHPDWDEYRAAMVAEQRLLARFSPVSVVGQIHG